MQKIINMQTKTMTSLDAAKSLRKLQFITARSNFFQTALTVMTNVEDGGCPQQSQPINIEGVEAKQRHEL